MFRGYAPSSVLVYPRFIASRRPDIAALSQATESVRLTYVEGMMEILSKQTSNQNGIRCRGMRTCLSHRVASRFIFFPVRRGCQQLPVIASMTVTALDS